MKTYVIDLLLRKLEDYEDNTVYVCDLAYTLLEEYNVNGSITYNVYEAQEWLKEHYGETYEFLENYRDDYGLEAVGCLAIDIFNNSEKAMTIICLELADDIVSSLDYIQNNWDNEITLDKKTIEIIRKELEEKRK